MTLDKKYKLKIRDLLKLFHPIKRDVNFEAFAKLCIDILQPYLEEKRNRYKISRYVYNFHSLTKRAEINRINLSYESLQNIIDELLMYENIDYKIAACIVGIPVNV